MDMADQQEEPVAGDRFGLSLIERAAESMIAREEVECRHLGQSNNEKTIKKAVRWKCNDCSVERDAKKVRLDRAEAKRMIDEISSDDKKVEKALHNLLQDLVTRPPTLHPQAMICMMPFAILACYGLPDGAGKAMATITAENVLADLTTKNGMANRNNKNITSPHFCKTFATERGRPANRARAAPSARELRKKSDAPDSMVLSKDLVEWLQTWAGSVLKQSAPADVIRAIRFGACCAPETLMNTLTDFCALVEGRLPSYYSSDLAQLATLWVLNRSQSQDIHAALRIDDRNGAIALTSDDTSVVNNTSGFSGAEQRVKSTAMVLRATTSEGRRSALIDRVPRAGERSQQFNGRVHPEFDTRQAKEQQRGESEESSVQRRQSTEKQQQPLPKRKALIVIDYADLSGLGTTSALAAGITNGGRGVDDGLSDDGGNRTIVEASSNSAASQPSVGIKPGRTCGGECGDDLGDVRSEDNGHRPLNMTETPASPARSTNSGKSSAFVYGNDGVNLWSPASSTGFVAVSPRAHSQPQTPTSTHQTWLQQQGELGIQLSGADFHAHERSLQRPDRQNERAKPGKQDGEWIRVQRPAIPGFTGAIRVSRRTSGSSQRSADGSGGVIQRRSSTQPPGEFANDPAQLFSRGGGVSCANDTGSAGFTAGNDEPRICSFPASASFEVSTRPSLVQFSESNRQQMASRCSEATAAKHPSVSSSPMLLIPGETPLTSSPAVADGDEDRAPFSSVSFAENNTSGIPRQTGGGSGRDRPANSALADANMRFVEPQRSAMAVGRKALRRGDRVPTQLRRQDHNFEEEREVVDGSADLRRLQRQMEKLEKENLQLVMENEAHLNHVKAAALAVGAATIEKYRTVPADHVGYLTLSIWNLAEKERAAASFAPSLTRARDAAKTAALLTIRRRQRKRDGTGNSERDGEWNGGEGGERDGWEKNSSGGWERKFRGDGEQGSTADRRASSAVGHDEGRRSQSSVKDVKRSTAESPECTSSSKDDAKWQGWNWSDAGEDEWAVGRAQDNMQDEEGPRLSGTDSDFDFEASMMDDGVVSAPKGGSGAPTERPADASAHGGVSRLSTVEEVNRAASESNEIEGEVSGSRPGVSAIFGDDESTPRRSELDMLIQKTEAATTTFSDDKNVDFSGDDGNSPSDSDAHRTQNELAVCAPIHAGGRLRGVELRPHLSSDDIGGGGGGGGHATDGSESLQLREETKSNPTAKMSEAAESFTEVRHNPLLTSGSGADDYATSQSECPQLQSEATSIRAAGRSNATEGSRRVGRSSLLSSGGSDSGDDGYATSLSESSQVRDEETRIRLAGTRNATEGLRKFGRSPLLPSGVSVSGADGYATSLSERSQVQDEERSIRLKGRCDAAERSPGVVLSPLLSSGGGNGGADGYATSLSERSQVQNEPLSIRLAETSEAAERSPGIVLSPLLSSGCGGTDNYSTRRSESPHLCVGTEGVPRAGTNTAGGSPLISLGRESARYAEAPALQDSPRLSVGRLASLDRRLGSGAQSKRLLGDRTLREAGENVVDGAHRERSHFARGAKSVGNELRSGASVSRRDGRKVIRNAIVPRTERQAQPPMRQARQTPARVSDGGKVFFDTAKAKATMFQLVGTRWVRTEGTGRLRVKRYPEDVVKLELKEGTKVTLKLSLPVRGRPSVARTEDETLSFIGIMESNRRSWFRVSFTDKPMYSNLADDLFDAIG